MVSSWYGPGFHGRLTASGEVFDKEELTAAHRTLPFGTVLCLFNPSTKKYAHVSVTDRGPYAEWAGVTYFQGQRDLDVSEAAAQALGMQEAGVVRLYAAIID